MYRIATIIGIVTTIECANYERYGDTSGRYPSSTIANLNEVPFKTGTYGSDIANFPEVTRYPNYNPGSSGYTTGRYASNFNDGYSTKSYNPLYSGGSSNVNYNQGYNNRGFNNQGYNNQGYENQGFNNQGYNQRYGEGYGQRSSMQGDYSSYEAPFVRDMGGCVNRSPQTGIWVDSLMGMWYGVELIQHLGADSRVDFARTCIVIHIAEPMDRPSTEHQLFHVQHINAKFHHDYRHLRLLWDEAGQTIEYALYFRNDSAGYWHVYDGQNGTLTNLPKYQQFGGTVQVLKAVNDHLVLNFCQEAGPGGRPAQLYSVLFSRNPGDLNQWEVEAVHNMLQNKKLSVASRRMVCGNSADKPLYSIVLSVLTCVLAYVVGSS